MKKILATWLSAISLFVSGSALADTTFDFNISGQTTFASGTITLSTAFVDALKAGAADISNYGGNNAIIDFRLVFVQGIKSAYNIEYTKANFRSGTNVAFATSSAVDINSDFFTSLSKFSLYLNSGSTQVLNGNGVKTNTVTSTTSSRSAATTTIPVYFAGPAPAGAPEIDGSLTSQALLLIAGLMLLNRRRLALKEAMFEKQSTLQDAVV